MSAEKKRGIQLSDHFTYGRLFRFTLPSIVMLIFSSLYGVVDGFFVSNFVGKEAFWVRSVSCSVQEVVR